MCVCGGGIPSLTFYGKDLEDRRRRSWHIPSWGSTANHSSPPPVDTQTFWCTFRRQNPLPSALCTQTFRTCLKKCLNQQSTMFFTMLILNVRKRNFRPEYLTLKNVFSQYRLTESNNCWSNLTENPHISAAPLILMLLLKTFLVLNHWIKKYVEGSCNLKTKLQRT